MESAWFSCELAWFWGEKVWIFRWICVLPGRPWRSSWLRNCVLSNNMHEREFSVLQNLLSLSSISRESLPAAVKFSRPKVRVRATRLPFVVRSEYLRPESEVTKSLFRSVQPEVMCVGPYNSGKTYPNLMRLYWLHTQIPNLQTLILRKKKVDLMRTTVPQWENKVLPFRLDDARSPCTKYGKSQPLWYDWKNGGRTYVGNCDESSGYLSGEYDLAFFCQAEQATLEDWELLAQRCDGRAGNWLGSDGIPFGQLVGDCNPDVPFHWIPTKIRSGALTELRFRHQDNMSWYRDGDWTPFGKRARARMAASLTGVRYRRGFLGEWAAAEGAVFDAFDPVVHVVSELPSGWETWPTFSAVDFGFDHPFVCLWLAIQPGTGHRYVVREWRRCRTLYEEHARVMREYSRPRLRWSDHDAAAAAELRRLGVPTLPADKEVLVGIDRINLALARGTLFFYEYALISVDRRLQEQGKPLSLIQEMTAYHRKPLSAQTGNSLKDDLPVKKFDDAIDPLRYIYNGLANMPAMFHPGLVAQRSYRDA